MLARRRRAIGLTAVAGLLFSVAAIAPASAKAKTTKKKTTKKAAAAIAKKPVTTLKPNANGTPNRGTVKIATIGTSVSATSGAKTTEETRKVAQAWAKVVNSNGGINGYKVEIDYKDSGGDTAKTIQAVKEIDKDGAVAIVGQTIFSTMSAAIGFIEQKKLPVIGGTPWFTESDKSPMFFSVSGNYSTGNYGIVSAAYHSGAKKFRKLYCSELVICAGSIAAQKDAAERLGMTFTSQAASFAKTDYTAECISAKNAGTDHFQIDGPPLAPIVRDCARQNYHPLWGNGGGSGQGLIDNLQGEQYANGLFELGIFNSFPEFQGLRDILKLTDLTVPQQTQSSLQTYESLEMARKILEKMTVTNPTKADFLEATYQIKGENLGGLLAPQGVDFSVQRDPNKHSSYDCWTEFIVTDGKFAATDARGNVTKSAKDNWQCDTGFYKASGFPIHPEW